jgi:hypothetical protein
MSYTEAEQVIAPSLSALGFSLDEVDADLVYGGRPAWALYYRGSDCKVQLCWSERNGGLSYLLAPLDAPNEFGLVNASKQWQYMLALSDNPDDPGTPPIGQGIEALWAWRKALFDKYFESARRALNRKASG